MTLGVSIVHFVIKVPKLVQMIVTIHRVKPSQVTLANTRYSPKIHVGRHKIQFFEVSTSDGGDFTGIIEIALLDIYLNHEVIIMMQVK